MGSGPSAGNLPSKYEKPGRIEKYDRREIIVGMVYVDNNIASHPVCRVEFASPNMLAVEYPNGFDKIKKGKNEIMEFVKGLESIHPDVVKERGEKLKSEAGWLISRGKSSRKYLV